MKAGQTQDTTLIPPSTYRIFLWVAAIAYPGWSVTLALLFPELVDDPAGRISLGIVCICMIVCSYRWERVLRILPLLTATALTAITTHFYYLVYLSEFDKRYATSVFLVLLCVSQGIQTTREYIIFSVISIVSAFIVAFKSDADMTLRAILCSGVVTAHLVQLITQYYKQKAQNQIRILALETARLQQLGRVAIRLGDRINNPLQSLILIAEEVSDEESSTAEATSLKIESAVQKIQEEVSRFATFKQFADNSNPDDMVPVLNNPAKY